MRRYIPALLLLIAAGTVQACNQGAPAPPRWTMVAHVHVGQTPGPVTLGGRWAFIANMSDGTVSQIERSSGRIVATIAVGDPKVLRSQGCAPDSVHAYYSGSWGWRLCDTPYAIAWDGTSLWALDNGRHQLVRVDPTSHQVADRVDLPGMGWSIAVGNGKAWVSGYSDHSLYEIDLLTRRLVTVVSNLDLGPATLAADGGAVWVVCVQGDNGIGNIDRVDPAGAQVVGRYHIEWWSEDVIANQGDVYVRGSFGGDISRINGTTGAIEWKQPGPGFIGRQGIDELGGGQRHLAERSHNFARRSGHGADRRENPGPVQLGGSRWQRGLAAGARRLGGRVQVAVTI